MSEHLSKIVPIAAFGGVGGFLLWVLSIFGHDPSVAPRLDGHFFSYVLGLMFHIVLGSGAGVLGVIFLAKTDLEKYSLHARGLAMACGLSWAVIFEGTAKIVETTVGKQEITQTERQGEELISKAEADEISNPSELGEVATRLYDTASGASDAKAMKIARARVADAIGKVEHTAEKDPVAAAKSLIELGEAAKIADDPRAWRQSVEALKSLQADPKFQQFSGEFQELSPRIEMLER